MLRNEIDVSSFDHQPCWPASWIFEPVQMKEAVAAISSWCLTFMAPHYSVDRLAITSFSDLKSDIVIYYTSPPKALLLIIYWFMYSHVQQATFSTSHATTTNAFTMSLHLIKQRRSISNIPELYIEQSYHITCVREITKDTQDRSCQDRLWARSNYSHSANRHCQLWQHRGTCWRQSHIPSHGYSWWNTQDLWTYNGCFESRVRMLHVDFVTLIIPQRR